uniref:Zn(2)-C6 fungal-type domain-containing protein n=1 Tax=Gibberella zeae TaxID=5518 RepID=A0A4E9D9K7_GIBZA
MVGVPGRSKGCITCRKRKKGCDKKMPFCGQCIALNIPCGGYDKQSIWLNSKGSAQTSYTKSSQSDSLDIKPISKPPRASVITLHDSLVRTARTQKFTGLFWVDYLSGGNGFSLKASGTTSFQRMRLYEDLSRVEPALQYVAMALSTATLGANSNDMQLTRMSQQAYGLALQQMAISLNAFRQDKDGMLAAIQLMRVYEVCRPILLAVAVLTERQQLFGTVFIDDPRRPTAQGFKKHIDGETALILSRGPDDTWSSMGRQLLADGCLTLWKRTPLWRSVANSPLNKLIDILVDVPGLLEDLDFLRQASHSMKSEELADRLNNACRECEFGLLAWEVEIGDILNTYDYTVVGKVLPRPNNDDDLAVIYLSCYYWMTCLMVYSTLGFCELEETKTSTKRDLMDCPSQRIATTYAYRIAHAIHLLFQPPAGDYSSVAAFFPLGNAIRYLIMTETYGGQRTMSNERLLLTKVFAGPLLGSFVGQFLKNLQADDGVDYGYPAERLVGMVGVEFRARVWWCGMQRAGVPDMPVEGACL